MSQHIGKISRDVGSGGERNRVCAVAADRYFPARDIEIVVTALLLNKRQANRARKRSRDPYEIRERPSGKEGIWYADNTQLFLNIGLYGKGALLWAYRRSSEF